MKISHGRPSGDTELGEDTETNGEGSEMRPVKRVKVEERCVSALSSFHMH